MCESPECLHGTRPHCLKSAMPSPVGPFCSGMSGVWESAAGGAGRAPLRGRANARNTHAKITGLQFVVKWVDSGLGESCGSYGSLGSLLTSEGTQLLKRASAGEDAAAYTRRCVTPAL